MKAQGLYVSPTEFVRFSEGKKRQLADHIATRDRSPDFHALGMYLPNPDPILKKQGKDATVYSDLRGDAHVGGCIRRRKAGVLKMEWRVNREKASARMTKLCESVLQNLDMRRLLREILDAPLFGWQPLEVIWSSGGGPIVPADVLAKPSGWFHFDPDSQLRFRSREAPVMGELLQPRKFLVPAQDASYANPYGFPDLSMCFWPTVFKRGGLKFWVTFTEKYGTPWLVGKTPRSTSGPDQDKLLDQLEQMVQDAVAVIPDDSSVEIVESVAKSANAELYEKLLMFCRSEVSIALLGQNQSTEATANRASAEAGLQVTDELSDADARLAEATVNQLFRWVTDLNEGEAAPAPKYELYEQEEVDQAQAERDERLVKAGAKLTSQYFKRTYKLEDGDILEEEVPPAPPVAPGANAAAVPIADEGTGFHAALKKALSAMQGKAVSFGEAQPAADEPDAVDALVATELDDWEPLLEPMMKPLQAAINRSIELGESAEELLSRLPNVLMEIQADALAESLTRAAFTARLGGAAGLQLDGEPTPAEFAEPAAEPAPVIPNLVIHVHNQQPEQPAPVVHATLQLGELPPAQVLVTNQIQPTPVVVQAEVQVQPAPVTVIDNHPVRAEQVVERDAENDITKTVTTYHRKAD